jgi:hypothetical protein
MSIRLTAASSQYLSCATALDYNANYTVIGVLRGVTNGDRDIFSILSSDRTQGDAISWDFSGNDDLIVKSVDQGGTITGSSPGSTFLSGTNYYLAMVHNGNAITLYIGTSPAAMAAKSTLSDSRTTGRTKAAATIEFGRPFLTANYSDARYQAWRTYEGRALTLSEIKAEAAFWPAQDRTSLWEGWRLQTAGAYTGLYNGRNLTAHGSPTTEADVTLTEPSVDATATPDGVSATASVGEVTATGTRLFVIGGGPKPKKKRPPVEEIIDAEEEESAQVVAELPDPLPLAPVVPPSGPRLDATRLGKPAKVVRARAPVAAPQASPEEVRMQMRRAKVVRTRQRTDIADIMHILSLVDRM